MSESQHGAACRQEIPEDGRNFLIRFSQSQHETGFCRQGRVHPPESGQKVEGMPVVRSRANLPVESWNGLDVVVQNVGKGFRKGFDRQGEATPKVRDQEFDPHRRHVLPEGFHDRLEMAGSPVGEVVPVNRCDDDVTEVHAPDGFREVKRFSGIRRKRFAMFDIAEGAGSCAEIAQNHERGRSFPEALADIGTSRFFADRVKAVLAQSGAKGENVRMQGGQYPQPVRLSPTGGSVPESGCIRGSVQGRNLPVKGALVQESVFVSAKSQDEVRVASRRGSRQVVFSYIQMLACERTKSQSILKSEWFHVFWTGGGLFRAHSICRIKGLMTERPCRLFRIRTEKDWFVLGLVSGVGARE